MTGFDGPRSPSPPPRSPRAPPASARPPPRRGTPRPPIGPAARSRIMNSWNAPQRPRTWIQVRTGSSLIGSTVAGTPSATRTSSAISVSDSPAASRRARARQSAEIAVAEVEPDVLAELPHRLHHRERVVAQSPAALVDPVGQPERDEVGIGGDVAAVDLDVVAGVGDHRRAGAGDVEQPARELGAAGPAGEQDDRAAHPPQATSGHGADPRGGAARRVPERARGDPDRGEDPADRPARAHGPPAAGGHELRARGRHPAARRRRGGAGRDRRPRRRLALRADPERARSRPRARAPRPLRGGQRLPVGLASRTTAPT